MNPDKRNECIDHDWAPSLEASGLECCAWPGCPATRESLPLLGDVSVSVVVVAHEEERAA